MATPAQRDLCCCLIQQYFGSVVASVAHTLFQFERAPLRLICSQGRTSWKDVKKSLIIMIKHQIINVYRQSDMSDACDYEITPELVINFSRSAKYIGRAKQLHGDEGELLIKNIIANGMIRVSTLLHSTWGHLIRQRQINTHEAAKNLLESIKSKILALIKAHYIERFDNDIHKRLMHIPVASDRRNNNELIPLLYRTNDIDLSHFSTQLLSINKFDIISELERISASHNNAGDTNPEEKPTKRAKFDATPTSDPDRGIYWRVNIDTFERDLRHRMLSNAVSEYFDDPRTGMICDALLNISRDHTPPAAAFTAPVSHSELEVSLMKSGQFNSKSELKKYLKTLDSTNNFRVIRQSGFRPDKGVMYAVDVGQLIDNIARETLASIVGCRFGPKCGRIFRLLLKKNYLVPKQIEESVMLPVKDVREYLYMLIKEGFVRSCQVPRTADFAPARSLYMMGVELEFLVMCTVDRCCRSMANVIERHNTESRSNETLLNNDQAVQNLLRSARSQNSQGETAFSAENLENDEEYQEYFTKHERKTLAVAKRRLNDLELSRHQIDDTLFLLGHWFKIKPNMAVAVEM